MRFFKSLSTGERIQLFILITYIVTLLVLVVNVIFFWKQYRSTQLLNKPLCAVKQLTVDSALEGKNIIKTEKIDKAVEGKPKIKIAAVIKNFGKYEAKKVNITWNMVALEGKMDKGKFIGWEVKGTTEQSMISTNLTVLPEHEFEQWIKFFEKKDLDELVNGYQKAVDVNISIKYLNMDNKTETYNCTYRITKMLLTEEYLYEVSLIRSISETEGNMSLNFNEFIKMIILPFIFTLISVIGALWYGNIGKPKLVRDPSPDETLDAPIGTLRRRSLRISVKNVPSKYPFVIRQTAVSCHGNIVFLDENKKPISKPMQIRWADSPEPIKQLIDNQNNIITLPEYNLVRLSKYIDIPPDESVLCDLAIRFVNEADAYGWCTDSYFKNYRHLDYKLDQGSYFAKITIITGDSTTELPPILFSNPTNFENFELG
ncbi:MAG: hypothetical protein NTZ24_14255 [Deltaproteobacteria bacterium]|nr:hypothetical protein [Deltaproteobacteria bacterium]